MKTPGQIIAANRAAMGLSLARVATPMGISVPYLHDIEHDRRRLPPKRWRALVAVLQGLSIRALATATASTGVVTIAAEGLTKTQRDVIADALIAEATS